MNRLAMVCGLFAAAVSSNAAFAQQMNADDLKWVNECIRGNRDEPGGTPRDHSRLLYLHERKDGRQRNPLDYAVGKGQPSRAARLRTAGRLEIAVRMSPIGPAAS